MGTQVKIGGVLVPVQGAAAIAIAAKMRREPVAVVAREYDAIRTWAGKGCQ